MGLLVDELEPELTRYVSIYRSFRQNHPAFASYAELPELVHVLRSAGLTAERLTLNAALVEAQRASPHRLWQALLLLSFAPMLKQLRGRTVTAWPEDLDERVILAFHEAVAAVSQEAPDRVTMRVRQTTQRLLFRALRHEARSIRLEREATALTHGRPPRKPDEDDVSDLVGADNPVARDLLETYGQYGRLQAYVRESTPGGSSAELGRLYKRLQQRRRRLVLHLRGANRAA